MVTVCGEALIDFLPRGDCYLPRPGGSPCNVAVGVARLGQASAFLGGLSTDALGQMLQAHFADNGVDTSGVTMVDLATPLALVEPGEESSYRFYFEQTAAFSIDLKNLPATLPAGPLHFGSLSLVVEPAARAWLELARREASRVITLDPNPRAVGFSELAWRRRLEEFLELASVIKVSQADLDFFYFGSDPEEMLRIWSCEKLVFLTLGGLGAKVFYQDWEFYAPAPRVQVVDTVGAGDAFMSAILAWLAERGGLADLEAGELEMVLARAVRAGALTCTRAGAEPPWASEL